MKVIALLLALIGAAALVAFAPILRARWSSSVPLKVAWEGPFIDQNVRDIGASMNECLGRPIFAEGAAFRAAGWFSGWDCRNVGSPDAIYSLDYDPKVGTHSFCRNEDGVVVGQSFNPTLKLSDLEFLATWKDPAVRENACGFFRAGFEDLAAGRRVLVHCEAGRDRTGTYAALLTAVVAEQAGLLDEAMTTAIECDYEKSRSLKAYKYGRMRSFLAELQATGGVARFLEAECGISRELLASLSARLTRRPAP